MSRYVRSAWVQHEIPEEAWIPYLWKDEITDGSSLGRAEFSVCLKFRRGVPCEYWVYPVQLRMNDCWHWSGNYTDFSISSYDGLANANAWLFQWCKEHKCITFKVYVPSYAKVLHLNHNGMGFFGKKESWMVTS